MIDISVYDNFLDGVLILDETCTPYYFNDVFCSITGLSPRKLQSGKSILEMIVFQEKDILSPEILTATKKSKGYRETAFYTLGRKRNEGLVQLSIVPLQDLYPMKLWVALLRDVSLEEKLQSKYKTEMEQKERSLKDLKEANKELEKFTGGLQKALDIKSKEILDLNEVQKLMIDSLNEAFMMFDRQGNIGPTFSSVSEKLLQVDPRGKKVWDLLRIPDFKRESFLKWWNYLFEEPMDFEEIRNLGIHTLQLRDTLLKIDFYPARDKNNNVSSIVLTAHDITETEEARKQIEKEQRQAKMILQIAKNRNQFTKFLRELQDFQLSLSERLSRQRYVAEDKKHLMQALHTIKGDASIYFLDDLVQFIHQKEIELKRISFDKDTVRYEIRPYFEDLVAFLKKYVKNKKDFFSLKKDLNEKKLEVNLESFLQLRKQIESDPQNAQAHLKFIDENMILQDVATFFHAWVDLVHDLALKLNKEVEAFEIHSNNIKVMPEVYEALFAAMIHAIRNSLDHGIEEPLIREKYGKNPKAKLSISCNRVFRDTKSYLQFRICDDGQGVHVDNLRDKFRDRVPHIESLSNQEVLNFLLQDDFTTSDSLSEVSGQGVGLSAIRIQAEKLNGFCEVRSTPGESFELFIEVPEITEIDPKSSVLKQVS